MNKVHIEIDLYTEMNEDECYEAAEALTEDLCASELEPIIRVTTEELEQPEED